MANQRPRMLQALCAVWLILSASIGAAQEHNSAGESFPPHSSKVELKRNLSETSDEPDWTNTDDNYQVRRFRTFRTDPSGWSQEGGLGLRWGMGLSDVQRLVPNSRLMISRPGPLHYGSVVQQVQGRDVTIHFEFFRGRLFEVSIHSFTSRGLNSHTYEDIGRSVQQAWNWREAVRKILNETHGVPACAPSERTRINLCDTGRYSCGPDTHARRESLLKWIWRTPETEIAISGVGNYGVTYRDLAMISIVEQARNHALAAAAREAAQREAAERQRLGGGNNLISLPSAPVPEIVMEFVVPPLTCVTEPDPSPNESTSDTTWSRAGWERIRWGMGPGDVRAVIGSGKEFNWTVGNNYRHDVLFFGSGIDFFNGESTWSFSFRNGHLQSFKVGLTCADSRGGKDECSARQKKIYSHFDKLYGRPYCREEVEDIATCHWDKPEHAYIGATHFVGRGVEFVSFTFDDPKDKAFRIGAELARTTVPPSKWSELGWNDFKWGMGVADVQKRLSAQGGAFKTTRAPLCAKKASSEMTSCTLSKRDHALRIQGVSPDLTFDFKEKSLQSIQLTFQDGIPRSSFWSTAEKLRELLTEKYGQADENLLGGEFGKSFSLNWSGKQFKGSIYANDVGDRPQISIWYKDPLPQSKSSGSTGRNGGL